MEWGGSGGRAPSRRKQGGLGADPTTLGGFCNFINKNNAFFAYFGKLVILKH